MPESAPLANPYVPFQRENPPKYEPSRGLIRGTLFPGLDLPFLGKVNTRELNQTPMTQLQALGFAVQELALYLDTHRDDREALEVYRAYQQMYRQCREQYESKHGPLNHQWTDHCEDPGAEGSHYVHSAPLRYPALPAEAAGKGDISGYGPL
jgi:spore coat protein JB